MPHPLFGPEIRLMLAEKDAAGLRAFCESLHPATVAEALDDFTPEQVWEVLTPSNIRTQAAIFEYLPPARQVEMVESGRPQIGQLLAKMSHDDRVDLLRRLPARVTERLLRLVDEADRQDIATLFTYAENTVGALMTTDYAWLPPTMTAAEAIDQLRQQAPDRETIYYIYVLDEPRRRPDGGPAPRRLLGVLSLRDLILAPRHALVRDLMEEETVTLKFDDDGEEAAQLLARYDFLAVPVVDDRRRAARHRHARRRDRRGHRGGDRGLAAAGGRRADRGELPGRRVRHRLVQPGEVAGRPVRRPDVHDQRDGPLRGGAGEGRLPDGVHPAVPVGRRERRVAGRHARHPGAGPGPGPRCRTGSGCSAGSC